MKKDKEVCKECKNVKIYWILALPILVMFVLVAIGLWYVNPALSLIYIGMWILANFCEGYCCADLQCPHAGKMCHPIGAFIFSSLIYDKFFITMKEEKREKLNLFMEYGSTILIILIILFPIYWLNQISTIFAILYPLICLLYAYLHFCIICPGCPVEKKCITGEARKYIKWGKDEVH